MVVVGVKGRMFADQPDIRQALTIFLLDTIARNLTNSTMILSGGTKDEVIQYTMHKKAK